MRRIRFEKGEQRKFLKRVLLETDCPSLRALNQFGLDVPYSTLKNYFIEARLLPEDFFKDLCQLANISPTEINVEYLEANFGQIKGGRVKA